MHIPHDREHAKTRGKPQHHIPVVAFEPVLPLAELIRVLVDCFIAKVVHDRGLDRSCTVRKNDGKDIIGQKVTDEFSFWHPAKTTNITCRLVIDKLFCPHQTYMGRLATGWFCDAQFLFYKAAKRRIIEVFVVIMSLSVRGHDKPVMSDLFLSQFL